jgi:hypothetical protein
MHQPPIPRYDYGQVVKSCDQCNSPLHMQILKLFLVEALVIPQVLNVNASH